MRACLALTVCLYAVAGQPHLGELLSADFDHIIILPDLHGDTEYLMYSLWLAAKNTNWPNMPYQAMEDILVNGQTVPASFSSPDRTALIQLGDVTNRGPGGKLCFSILFSLERLFGWRVISLFGNHELMSFTGKDARYVHNHEYLFYKNSRNRAAEFSRGGSLWTSINSKYLLLARLTGDLPTLQDSLFVHGGVNLTWLSSVPIDNRTDIHELNKFVRRVMADPNRAESILGLSESPLWTRDFSEKSRDRAWCETSLPEILSAFGVSRVFVGHAPLDSKRVELRCGGRIVLTDVTMSRWMGNGGQPIAIVIETAGNVTAHYYDPSTGEEESDSIPPVQSYVVDF